MPDELLGTKLTIPPLRTNRVSRQGLIERLDRGRLLGHKLTLISAPAGFGKTTLVGDWVAGCQASAPDVRVAWLSLDEGDGDLARFLTYLIAAIQTVTAREAGVGQRVLGMLQSPQPPPAESLLTVLVNDISALRGLFILVLDDYHVLESSAVDKALAFLLEHLPPQMHLVITTREDPNLPLARLRARGQLTELRVTDLRFTLDEATAFLNRVMGLNLSAQDVAALENRTEGWVAGLQLAAISMRGQEDATAFIEAFTGSHRFVLDYLIEEVLEQQPQSVQRFLLITSILDRLCGPLCDALTRDPAVPGQETLQALEQANLFLVPLDDQRRWYRYHHLFAELLRQRLQQSARSSSSEGMPDVAQLHSRAGAWYEENGLDVEAFRHAAAANDVDRAARLIEGQGMPLHYRGAMIPVMNWLASLPADVMDSQPSLWVTYASALTMVGQAVDSIEEKLRAAETALGSSKTLQDAEPDETTRDLVGQIAAIRAMLAVPQNQVPEIIDQARRALALVDAGNVPVRTAATWALGHAYQLQGDHAAARQAFSDISSTSQASGNIVFEIAANTGLGQIEEAENNLHLAAKYYRRVLELAGEPPLPVACGAYLGLAHISYQWNDLDAAQENGRRCMQLARLLENLDTPASCGVLLARAQLARGDVAKATALLGEAEEFVRQNEFAHRMPEVAAAQALAMLHQGHVTAAAALAEAFDLPFIQARVHLAQEDPVSALALLEPMRRRAQEEGWAGEQLKVIVLQALALQAQGAADEAAQRLAEALALAQPGGFIRLFVDEGPPMAALLSEAAKRGIAPGYVRRLQAAFVQVEEEAAGPQHLPDPLTDRELDVLRMLATELNGPQIARELLVSLNTMRTHTKNIYSKLGANNRRTAVRRAEELGLL